MTGAPHCPQTPDVLARHLDGDLDAWPDAAAHAQDCTACRLALARGRRLDAALAEAAGRAAAVLDRNPASSAGWLATAEQRARGVQPFGSMVASRRARTRVLLAIAVLGAAVATVADLALHGHEPATATPGATAPEPTMLAQVDVTDHPDQAASRPATASTDDAAAEREPILLAKTSRATAPAGVAAAALALARVPRDPASVQRLGALLENGDTDARQQRAAELLLEAGNPAADAVVLRWMGCSDATPALDRILIDARRRSTVSGRLARRLAESLATHVASGDGLAMVCAAARLGDRVSDEALRRSSRRDPGLLEVTAAALRTPCHRPGRSRLLLDLWSDASGRGLLADDEAAAALLFTGQPPGAARELVEELLDSGNAARRLRCLLGLGVLADATVRPQLERLLQGPARPEAVAAAWALGRLKPDELQDLAARAAQKGPGPQWLVRAALLTAGAPAGEAWLQTCELGAEERALAGKVRPGLADFERIAELLRLRAAPPP